jgi:hypothetical protein
MSKVKDVTIDHPIAANRTKRNVVDDSKKLFDKLDGKDKPLQSPEEKTLKIKQLKELIFLGNLSKTIEKDGFFFQIRTLSNAESRELTKRLILMDDTDRLTYGNILHIATSLEKINGLDIDDVYEELFGPTEELITKLDKNLEILSTLNTHLVSFLIDEYFLLSNESKKSLGLIKENKEEDEQRAENLKS